MVTPQVEIEYLLEPLKYYLGKLKSANFGRHDIQHNSTQYNVIQDNDTQHKGPICDT
jgi:hypothetical protein